MITSDIEVHGIDMYLQAMTQNITVRPEKPGREAVFTGRIRPDLKVKLRNFAYADNRSLNNLIELVLNEYVSAREERERGQRRGRSSATQANAS